MSIEIKDFKRLRQLIRRASVTSKRKIRSAVLSGRTMLGSEPVKVIGLVYPDGKTLNVLIEKKSCDKSIAMEIDGSTTGKHNQQLDLVAEAPGWVQFFGRIPDGLTAFELRVRRDSRRVPMIDSTSGPIGRGHISGARSWKSGARWESTFAARSLYFNLMNEPLGNSVLSVIPGLGRLTIQLSHFAESGTVLDRIVLRARGTGQELSFPVRIDHGHFAGIIDGKSIVEELGRSSDGSTVWDVLANGTRLRIGETDISDPRKAFRFGWVRAKSGGGFVKIRPYWTINGYLSLEIKFSAANQTQNDTQS